MSPAPAAVRLFIAALAGVFAFACSDGRSQSRDLGGQVQLGFDLSHLTASCAAARPTGGRGPRTQSGVAAGDNVLLHYDSPQVGSRARSILRTMAGRGAMLVRTTLWFDHAEDSRFARLPDRLGIATASQGRLPQTRIDNLFSFASDARNLGYRTVAVAIAPLGDANPKCRGAVFAGCYDRAYLDRSWSVVDQVAARLLPLSSPTFHVVLDISPENCASDFGGRLLHDAQDGYTRFMVQHFMQKYGGRGFYVSCGGVPEARARQGLASLVAAYRDLKARPSIIDLHLYAEDEQTAEGSLRDAQAAAEDLHVPLYVLETFQDDAPVFTAISRLRRSGKLASLGALSVWPLKMAQSCQVGLAPPLDLGLARAAVGR